MDALFEAAVSKGLMLKVSYSPLNGYQAWVRKLNVHPPEENYCQADNLDGIKGDRKSVV